MTDVKEEPEKITDDGAEKDKKIAAHPRNDTDQEKEEMKRKIGALQQVVNFKDSIIRKQKAIIKGKEERHTRTEEQEPNRVRHPGSINHFGAAEMEAEGMKLKIALLEKLLVEEHHKNRTLSGKIQEMRKRQGSEITFIKRNRETGKSVLLRKIQQMRKESRTRKERRTPSTENNTEDNKQNGRNEHAGKSRARLPTILEEPW